MSARLSVATEAEAVFAAASSAHGGSAWIVLSIIGESIVCTAQSEAGSVGSDAAAVAAAARGAAESHASKGAFVAARGPHSARWLLAAVLPDGMAVSVSACASRCDCV